MRKLHEFYDIMNRNAHVTISSSDLDECFYAGLVKSIPDTFDDFDVIEFVELFHMEYHVVVKPV